MILFRVVFVKSGEQNAGFEKCSTTDLLLFLDILSHSG